MGRTPCCDKNGLKKGPWTPEEDLKLTTFIQMHGPGNWRTLPRNAGLQRCGKSCRLRWTNYLRPDIKRGRFSFEEEESIIQLHSILGNKWSAIAARLPGRTDNEIKNYWNTHIRKRLLRIGIDPVTHSPRLDLLDLSSILNSSLCNPALLNVSNFLGSQSLVNPDLLNLATNLLRNLQDQNQLSQLQNQLLQLQTTQFQAPFLNQTLPMQPNADDQGFSANMAEFGCQNSQENQLPASCLSSGNFVSQPNYAYGSLSSPTINDVLQESSNLQPGNKGPGNQNLSFDSVMSTPSSSTFINGSTDDDHERESYCSDLWKFEIPESLDITEFM